MLQSFTSIMGFEFIYINNTKQLVKYSYYSFDSFYKNVLVQKNQNYICFIRQTRLNIH